MDTSNYQELWEEICFILSKNIDSSIGEKHFEEKVLRTIEKLGWHEYKNEIRRQPMLQFGKKSFLIPALVLYDQENQALISIEVKRPSENLSKANPNGQLKSYMRQMKAEFGLLVGEEIRIYYDGSLNPLKTEPLLLDKVLFDKDSKAGWNFVEIFTKDNFLSKKYLPYLEKEISKLSRDREVKKLIDELHSDTTKAKVIEFLKHEYADFDSDVFSLVMNSIKIDFIEKHKPQPLNDTKQKKSDTHIIGPSPNGETHSGKTYTLEELEKMPLEEDKRPSNFEIRSQQFAVKGWKDLIGKFVNWLIMNNLLNFTNTPILDHTQTDKYFINTQPRHKALTKDGKWDRVGSFYIDTKYDAEGHKKNIIHALRHLGVRGARIKITFI